MKSTNYETYYTIFFGILLFPRKGRDHSENQGVDGGTILEWILGKLD